MKIKPVLIYVTELSASAAAARSHSYKLDIIFALSCCVLFAAAHCEFCADASIGDNRIQQKVRVF